MSTSDGSEQSDDRGGPSSADRGRTGTNVIDDPEGEYVDAEEVEAESEGSRIRPENDPAAQLEQRPTGEERVGEVLSRRYRLTEFLGRGAMGEVFRAEHVLMKKTVAIKILHSDVSGHTKIVERFRREAQAAANIDHPNVCVATDFGQTSEKDFFLVMEFLEGETLKEIVDREGAFEVDRALYIANQICSALVRAHEVGVVHRDLKPDNIMLVERGDDPDFVKILDFGIAQVRMGDETPEMTKTGAVFGTPSYMSPEQAAGDPVDHRTDLYSLGSLLFEMLTGRRVFQADRGAEVMAKHVSQEPPTPSEEAPHDEVGDDLDALILQLLEKNPDRRPQTSVELQRQLLALDSTTQGGAFPGVAPEVSVAPELSASELSKLQEDEEGGPPSEEGGVLTETLDSVSDWLKRRGTAARWASVLLAFALFTAAIVAVGTSALNGTLWDLTQAERRARARTIAEERRTFTAREPVRTALRRYDRGAIVAGIHELENLKGPAYEDNPHLEFLIGRGYAELDRWTTCLDHFERVVELEPGYIEQRKYLEYLIGAFETEQKGVAKRVRELLEPNLDREIVRSHLARAAWRGSTPSTRRRARKLLEESGTIQELPKWVRLSIALREARGCKQHRKRIEQIAKLGNPRGLEILRIYDGYSDSVVGCVREDLSKAIRTLEENRKSDKRLDIRKRDG